MKVPILNTIYSDNQTKLIKSKIDLKSVNNLSLVEVLLDCHVRFTHSQ